MGSHITLQPKRGLVPSYCRWNSTCRHAHRTRRGFTVLAGKLDTPRRHYSIVGKRSAVNGG